MNQNNVEIKMVPQNRYCKKCDSLVQPDSKIGFGTLPDWYKCPKCGRVHSATTMNKQKHRDKILKKIL